MCAIGEAVGAGEIGIGQIGELIPMAGQIAEVGSVKSTMVMPAGSLASTSNVVCALIFATTESSATLFAAKAGDACRKHLRCKADRERQSQAGPAKYCGQSRPDRAS